MAAANVSTKRTSRRKKEQGLETIEHSHVNFPCTNCNNLFKNKTAFTNHLKICSVLKKNESFLKNHEEKKSDDTANKVLPASQPLNRSNDQVIYDTASFSTRHLTKQTQQSSQMSASSTSSQSDTLQSAISRNKSFAEVISSNDQPVQALQSFKPGSACPVTQSSSIVRSITPRPTQVTTMRTLNDDDVAISNDDEPSTTSFVANLPAYTEVNKVPSTTYNNVDPKLFVQNINQIYEDMVSWRKNLFSLPTGKAGKYFVGLISEWISHYNKSDTFQSISMKVVMILPNLLLQKPSSKSKASDHTKFLEERLKLWEQGKVMELFKECKMLQKKLLTGKRKSLDDLNKIFTKLVLEGKPSAALKFLEENAENAVLPSSEAIVNKLKDLHPSPAEILPDALLSGPIETVPAALFASIDEEEVLKAANQTKGSGGPSLFDAKQWRRILGSKKFSKEGKQLREEIALFARKISTEIVDPQTLEAYTASRLIPLNKTPGELDPKVRPIGVGEVLRRIVGKTISWALSGEIQSAGGSLQVSTGLKGGSEAAIHAMKEIFDMESTDAIILVDAENAFNKLNRQVALHNIRYICPAFSTVLINTYRKSARLFVVGGGEISSAEGTTQGDALAMQFYGLSTKPIMLALDFNRTQVHQVWLADDATGAGTLRKLKLWWNSISFEGKKYGYHVKPSKSWLILKDGRRKQEAENIFENSLIQITTIAANVTSVQPLVHLISKMNICPIR